MKGILKCKILHWGPLFALWLISFISFTTLFFNQLWLPIQGSLTGFVVHLILVCIFGLIVYNFFCAVIVGPGHVPPNWAPPNESDTQFLQKCNSCEAFKCPRSHHCRRCNRCILKMDHHCPWINNCIGHCNYLNFMLFLTFSFIGCSFAGILLFLGIKHSVAFYEDEEIDLRTIVIVSWSSLSCAVFTLGLIIAILAAVGFLLVLHTNNILKNKTAIEHWIIVKAQSRPNNENFVYPYNIGYWNNFLQFFATELNGIWWPVRPNCDQYTLTREQLLQKEEKRSRIRIFKVTKKYTGSWFPLISQGPVVCLHCPFSDDPRIKLAVDDMINVTRLKKHWYYGEIFSSNVQALPRVKPRGWFPKRCVVEVENFLSVDTPPDESFKKII